MSHLPPVDVSVIIPLYRVEEDVEHCIQSLAAQDVPFELILVNDASDDDSLPRALSALAQLGRDIPHQVITHEQNQGVSAARNSGMEAAKGRYLFYLDGDDSITPNCLQEMLQLAQEQQADIVFGQFQTLGEDELHWLDATCPALMLGEEALDCFFLSQWPQSSCNKLVSLEFLRRHQIRFPLGLKLHEDTLWTLACAIHQPRVVKLEKQNYLYKNNRESSITSRFATRPTQELFNQRQEVLHEYERLGEQHGLYARDSFCRFLYDYAFQLYRDSLWRQRVSLSQRMRLTRRYLASLKPELLRKNLNHPLKFSQIAAKICLLRPRILAFPLMLLYTSEPSKRAYIKRNTP